MASLTLSDWNGDKFEKLLDLSNDEKLKTLGILLVNELKAEVSAKGNIHHVDPSNPGEPPAKVTGRLAGSIVYRILNKGNEKVLVVGSSVLYGKFLELGTKKMNARPWLRPVLRKNLEKIKKMFK